MANGYDAQARPSGYSAQQGYQAAGANWQSGNWIPSSTSMSAPSGYQQPAQWQAAPAAQAAEPADAKGVVMKEEKVEICQDWSSPFKCPLTLFAIIAVIMFIYDVYYIFTNSGSANGTFWLVSIIALLVYVGLALVFGMWIKRNCNECKYGTSWLIFLAALFFPIILGFIVSIFIGAFTGGLAFLSGSLGAGGSKGGKAAKAPKKATPPAAPAVPTPAVVAQQASQAAQQAQAEAQQAQLDALRAAQANQQAQAEALRAAQQPARPAPSALPANDTNVLAQANLNSIRGMAPLN